MKPRPVSRNIQIIDLVRTAAILPVLAVHLKPTLPLPPPLWRWGWDHFQRNGGYGVEIFFIVSGFLITKILAEGPKGPFKADWKHFYARRAARILPLFLFVLAIGLVFYFAFQDCSKKFNFCFKLPAQPWDPTFWVPLLLFLFNWARCFLGPRWQGAGGHWEICWSLAVEEQFYLAYPYLLRKLGDLKNLVFFLGSVVLFGLFWRVLMVLLPFPDWVEMKWSSFGCFDLIAYGALLYFSQKAWGPRLKRSLPLARALTILGSLIFCLTYLFTFGAEKLDSIYGPTLIGIGVFLFLLGGMNLECFDSPNLKPFTYPGKYSYGNYLFHFSVLYFIHSFLWNLNIGLAFLIYVSVSTSLAAVSFHYFETPANRWVRSLLGQS